MSPEFQRIAMAARGEKRGTGEEVLSSELEADGLSTSLAWMERGRDSS
jgi:hypothetical protein